MALVIAAAVVVALVIALLVWWVTTSNNFARADVKVAEGLSGIEVALTKRFDLLTKLRDAARSYAVHEKDTLTEVTALRKGMSVTELSAASSQADALSAHLQVIAENYPQLQASEVFVRYQSGIVEVEEHLQAARRLYNSNVARYNTMLRVFPSSLVGSVQKLTAREFFQAEDHKRADVPA